MLPFWKLSSKCTVLKKVKNCLALSVFYATMDEFILWKHIQLNILIFYIISLQVSLLLRRKKNVCGFKCNIVIKGWLMCYTGVQTEKDKLQITEWCLWWGKLYPCLLDRLLCGMLTRASFPCSLENGEERKRKNRKEKKNHGSNN